MTIEDKSYTVGYGKPPRHTQFNKGRSGNPKGRGKGSKNFATEIQNELAARVPIVENGRRRNITKRSAVAKQLVNKAAAGDPRAIPILLNETRPYEGPSGAYQLETVRQEDQLVIASIVKRIRAAEDVVASLPAPPANDRPTADLPPDPSSKDKTP